MHHSFIVRRIKFAFARRAKQRSCVNRARMNWETDFRANRGGPTVATAPHSGRLNLQKKRLRQRNVWFVTASSSGVISAVLARLLVLNRRRSYIANLTPSTRAE